VRTGGRPLDLAILGTILVLGAAPLSAELHYSRLYVSGRQAVLAGEHHRGVLRLLSAVQKNPIEGDPWIRIYGRHRAPYVPYFYLGKAFFELGQYDQAETAWEESRRQGAIVDAEEYEELLRYLERLSSDVVGILRSDVRSRIMAARQLVEELDEALERLPPNDWSATWRAQVVQLGADARELEDLLDGEREIRVAQLLAAAQALEERLGEAGLLERRVAEMAAAERLEARLQRWLELQELLATGACLPEVLAELESLLGGSWEELEAIELARDMLVVAQGWLDCDEPRAARSVLLAVPPALRQTAPWSELERDVALAMRAAADREASILRRELAHDLADAASSGRCDPGLVDAVLPLADAGDRPLEEEFRTSLARVLAACDRPEAALRQLERARAEGVWSLEIDRLASTLERMQNERAQAARLDAMYRRYESLLGLVTSSTCATEAVTGFEDLLREAGSEALRPGLDLELARAHLACGDPDSAERALERLEGPTPPNVEEARRLASIIAEQREQIEEASRRRFVEERLSTARGLLAGDMCSRAALAMLAELSPADDSERDQAALLLARGHLACGELDAVRRLVDEALTARPVDPHEWPRVREELEHAEERRARRLWVGRLEQALSAGTPELCGRDVAEDLLELHGAAPPMLGHLAVELRLALGHALLACGELRAAEEILAELEGASATEWRALAEKLGAEAERHKLHERREAVLAAFVEGTAAVLAGRCDALVLSRLRQLARELPMGEAAPELHGWLEERTGVSYAPELYLAEGYQICGDEVETARFLGLARPWLGVADQWRAQHLERWLRHRQAARLYENRVALLIGASEYARYRAGWWNLPGVDRDIGALRSALEAYGFDEVRVLEKPVTRKRIEEALTSFISDFGSDPENRNLLFIYFAGHGATLRERYPLDQGGVDAGSFEAGFLVPEDAPRPEGTEEGRERFLEMAIGMDEVDRWARLIQSPQAFFVFDSCFSGTIFRAIGRSRGLLRPAVAPEPTMLPAIVRSRAALPVRLFATAGAADQLVPDQSIFSRLLIDVLTGQRRDADFTGDGFLLGQELCLFLEDQVTELTGRAQTPQCGTMPPPFNEGDVVFRALEAEEHGWLEPSEGLEAQMALWNEIRDTRDPAVLRGYLEEFPEGHFAGLVKYRLESTPD
jgi:hypothetical protein